jgi:hypothetical protein
MMFVRRVAELLISSMLFARPTVSNSSLVGLIPIGLGDDVFADLTPHHHCVTQTFSQNAEMPY